MVEHVKVKRLCSQRKGSPRHRHLPAQGRKEPGFDRTDRRHQLSQNRRIWLRQRPARIQLRRRIQHRQPRHVEFIEVLKLDVAFLYDLLGASQEHLIKPKKFAQTYIDEVILGHTNEPEYRKLQGNEFMEAFRDRTIKIDVPYVTTAGRRDQDLREGFRSREVRGKHIAPHTSKWPRCGRS